MTPQKRHKRGAQKGAPKGGPKRGPQKGAPKGVPKRDARKGVPQRGAQKGVAKTGRPKGGPKRGPKMSTFSLKLALWASSGRSGSPSGAEGLSGRPPGVDLEPPGSISDVSLPSVGRYFRSCRVKDHQTSNSEQPATNRDRRSRAASSIYIERVRDRYITTLGPNALLLGR